MQLIWGLITAMLVGLSYCVGTFMGAWDMKKRFKIPKGINSLEDYERTYEFAFGSDNDE